MLNSSPRDAPKLPGAGHQQQEGKGAGDGDLPPVSSPEDGEHEKEEMAGLGAGSNDGRRLDGRRGERPQ